MNDDGEAIIADFGLSRIISQPLRDYTNEVTTLCYRAPELLVGETKYSIGIDLWAVGCLFAEIATGETLFLCKSELELLFQMCRLLGTPSPDSFPAFMKYIVKKSVAFHLPKQLEGPKIEEVIEKLPPEGRLIVLKMLNFDPSKRLTCREALLLPFFSS